MARARVRGRLWRERMQREIDAAGGAPQLPTPKLEEPPPLTRGGAPKHPRWFRVLAMVQKREGVGYDFVAEAKTASGAIVLASRYSHRAVVTDWHSKVHFNNGKPIERED